MKVFPPDYLSRHQKPPAVRLRAADRSDEQDERWQPTVSCTKRIFLNTAGQILILGLNEVIYLKSSSNYTIIKMSDDSQHISCKHLKTYSDLIGSNPDFLRIHRSSIVNKNFVKAIFRNGHKISILMKDNERLDVSAQKKGQLLEELSK